MEQPDVYQLTRIRWQIFGTLTFRSERLPEKTRLSMWFALCRKTSSDFGCYFPNLLWCLRQERGEATGRRHFHYLLGGLPEKAVTVATCMASMATWEKRGGGMARVRIFNRALNGVAYFDELCNALSGSAAADQYEMCKYGLESSEVVWSKGALAMLERRIREDRRRVQRAEKRREIEASAQSVTHQANATSSVPRQHAADLGAAQVMWSLIGRGDVNGGDWAESSGRAGD